MATSAQAGQHSLPRYWRIPPWQAATLILAAAALLAVDIYGRPSIGPMIACALVAAACLFGAVIAMRFLMVADDEGIWVRRVLGVQFVEWAHIADIEMTLGRHNAATVRITRRNGTFVDVPPSLILPTRPTGIRKVRSIIAGVAIELTDIAKQQTSRPV